MSQQPAPTDKEQPLIDDIRLLGKLLGDVIRRIHDGRSVGELFNE